MEKIKKFRILKVIHGENNDKLGICEIIIPQTINLGLVREYKSKHGIFYTSVDRLIGYKKRGEIEIIE